MDTVFPSVDPKKCLKTYSKSVKNILKSSVTTKPTVLQLPISSKLLKCRKLTTKEAVKLLLEGRLKTKVCRYCLEISSPLSHLDQIIEVAGKEALYKVSIKDIIASCHPFKVVEDPNFPDRICETCLDRATTSYLFIQQCEQAERALRNCFQDMFDKLNKLDPLEHTKKRGRQKLHPNHNILYAEHEKVIDYAEPVINIVNTSSQVLTENTPISELECLKCCEILPSTESLISHTKIHPKTMWYNCRLCGTSFTKRHLLKKHFTMKHSSNSTSTHVVKSKYDCKRCGEAFDKYYEFLQHIEKHKFKQAMEHLVEGKMDKLCTLCFGKGMKMIPLDERICLHGGSPALTGERSLYTVLASTLPEMNILDNYSGTKVCEKCLNNVLTAYIFINQTSFARNRLGSCISNMLEKLNYATEISNNICIEIAETAIMKVVDILDEDVDEINEDSKLMVEVLEDEFRVQSDDESELEMDPNTNNDTKHVIDNKNYDVHSNNMLNGYTYANQICGEFLKFKKKIKPKKAKFTCPVCLKYFISDYFLKRHVLKHVPRRIDCIICNVQFRSKFDFYEHKKISHTLSKYFYLTCKICGRCFVEQEKLKLHEKLHSDQLCQLCDKRFNTQSSFLNHMQRHVSKLRVVMKKYKQSCTCCEKECSNDNELSLHMNKVHFQIKPYSCDMCEKLYYTEHNLRNHKKLHSVFSKEQCEFCNKMLSNRKKLVIHIRKHIGDTPFFCQICNLSFYSQYLLKKHMISNHGGRYLCKVCKTAFEKRSDLKDHSNTLHNYSMYKLYM